jgi:hypothetical protein
MRTILFMRKEVIIIIWPNHDDSDHFLIGFQWKPATHFCILSRFTSLSRFPFFWTRYQIVLRSDKSSRTDMQFPGQRQLIGPRSES